MTLGDVPVILRAQFPSILVINSLRISDDKSTSVQVMAWCHLASSRYLNQCWPRSMTPYDIIGNQRVKARMSTAILLLSAKVDNYLFNILVLKISKKKISDHATSNFLLATSNFLLRIPPVKVVWYPVDGQSVTGINHLMYIMRVMACTS